MKKLGSLLLLLAVSMFAVGCGNYETQTHIPCGCPSVVLTACICPFSPPKRETNKQTNIVTFQVEGNPLSNFQSYFAVATITRAYWWWVCSRHRSVERKMDHILAPYETAWGRIYTSKTSNWPLHFKLAQ